MTKRHEGFIPQLQDWFGQLKRSDQEALLIALEQGDGALQQWLEENAPEVKESFLELEQFTSDLLKEDKAENVRNMLAKLGLETVELTDALVRRLQHELRFYFDAAELRDTTLEQFESIAAKVIADFFVERRYSTWEKRSAYLGLTEEKEVRDCYMVVINLIHNFYDQNATLEILEMFINKELGISSEKAGKFTEILVRNREALDRHFLFRRFSSLVAAKE